MKKILGILTICLMAATISFSQNVEDQTKSSVDESEMGPLMKFEDIVIDYGVIQQNSEPYREFKFVNTGNAPLVISNAKGSCGCTVPEWPKEPIAPRASNTISVRYATNRIGKFSKKITLTTNEVKNSHVLTIKGEVLKPQIEDSSKSDNSNSKAGKKN